jgi:hypothetical protein
MTPEQKRTAIAEACGWQELDRHSITERGITLTGTLDPRRRWWRHAESKTICDEWDIPDYLNDLNAMHEAEKIFADDDSFRGYEAQLDKVVPMSERWIFATAAQRADAFIATLGLDKQTNKDQ